MATMKAVQLSKDGESAPTLKVTLVPKPTIVPGSLLIKVHASGIQPSDLINSKGGFGITTYPRIPGRDFAGVVVEGPESRIGEEVYGTSGNKQAFTVDGAQAEYILVPEQAVAPKPKGLTFTQAATIGVPFTTAATVLKKTGAKKGDIVLVLGANGAVGSAAVQLAKGLGCRVLQGSRKDDADVNTSTDPEFKAVDGLTDGKGLDIVVDTVGQPAITAAAVSKLGRGGRLGFIAAPRSGSTDLTFDMVGFYRMERQLVGCNTLLYSAEDFAEELKVVTDMFENGLLKISEGEWTHIQIDDAVAAYQKAGERGAGKFVIVMN